tara:strand:+ start:54 stop:263 length:210 start_codon:yes stop_codon:yes gene_type:complete
METLNLNQITWRQFQTTKFYTKRFNMDKTDLGVVGARRQLAETWEYLKKQNAILVDGEKVQFPNEGCLY